MKDENEAWCRFVDAYEAMDEAMQPILSVKGMSIAQLDDYHNQCCRRWEKLRNAWRAYCQIKDGKLLK